MSAGHGWSEAQARELRDALPPDPALNPPLSYCQLAGFLFAVACAPGLVMPSRWIPMVLGNQGGHFKDEATARRAMDLVLALYNEINDAVRGGRPELPALVELRRDPADDIGPQAPLDQWASGAAMAQLWLKPTWDEHLEKDGGADARDLRDALESAQTTIAFFLRRESAQAWVEKDPDRPGFAPAARRMRELLPDAMKALADVGAFLEAARGERLSTPARSTKVGRNAPCPCGSGRKYKHCCGAGR